MDLDGTVYLGNYPVQGVADFISYVRSSGLKLMFVTNRANRLPSEIRMQLASMGIDCSEDEILTSSQATADYLEPAPVYMIGEIGLEQALKDRGFTFSDDNVRYVIVSFDRSFTYEKMTVAANLIYRGAEFIATNPDKGLPSKDRIYPGTGSIVAAIEAVVGKPPRIIGKPEPLILEMAACRLGAEPRNILAVGDNHTTDIPSGVKAGMLTALILTGISSRKDAESAAVQPTFTVNSYSELKNILSGLI